MADDEKASTQAGLCDKIRKCCLYKGCAATFSSVSGSDYVFDHCGCDNLT